MFFFGNNQINLLHKDYVDILNSYYFQYDKEANSIEEALNFLPEEIFRMV